MAEGQGSAVKWIALGCGLFVLVGACGIGAALVAFGNIEDAPQGQARGFFVDLRAGRYQDALARTNAVYQSTHTVEGFSASVAAIPAATQQTDVQFTNNTVTGTSANMGGNLITPSGAVPITVALSRVGEHWYIDAVVVEGQPLQ
jgi:hypothetical protein